MTQAEIIRMAQEAGLICESRPVTAWIESTDLTPYLTRFAALVAAYEREKLHNEIATLQCDIEEMYSRADVDYLIGVEREACAKVCEEIEQDRWNLYKGRPPYTGSEAGRADPHEQGVSMGAGECAAAIRARGRVISD